MAMPTITRGDLVALTAPQPLVSGITIPARTQFEVLAVFTNSHGDVAVNLARPGIDEIAASCVDVGRVERVEIEAVDDEPFDWFSAA